MFRIKIDHFRLLQHFILWNFMEERENRWIYMDDRDEVVVVFSDSEDSDWSG